MSFVIELFLAAVATMWKTASTAMGPEGASRAARAARAAGDPVLGFPWSAWMVFRKSSEAWEVSVPQSKLLCGSLAAARRPSEARRTCVNIDLVAKGDEECAVTR
jgi:hypothetical protein